MTFSQVLSAADALSAEDRRLLVRELSEDISPAERWTLVRGLVAVEPAEDLPQLFSGRQAEARLLDEMVLSFRPDQQPELMLVEAFEPSVQQTLPRLVYAEDRRRRHEGQA